MLLKPERPSIQHSIYIHQMQSCMRQEHGGYLVLMHAVIQVILGAMKLQVQGFPFGCGFDLQNSTRTIRTATPQQPPMRSHKQQQPLALTACCQRKNMLFRSIGQQMSALPCNEKTCPAKQADKTTTASANHRSNDNACPAVQGAYWKQRSRPTAARSSPLP